MNLNDKIEYNGEMISYGRYLFNECLPDDYPLVDEVVTKKKLQQIINDITLRYPPAVVIQVLDNIKELGFKLSTSEGYTMGLDDLYSKEVMGYARQLTGDPNTDITRLKKDAKIQQALKNMPFSIFIESGARGSWDQARQMVLARGYVADANNQIRPELIRSSLVEGLSPKEFFNSCWGSRKGLLDTALSTGDSGYLTRQLIYSTTTVELDETPTGDDCGTTDGLFVTIKNKNMIRALLGRCYIKEDGRKKLIRLADSASLIGKTIKLRSPIYCKGKKICRTCYGNLYRILHSPQIGIIATQAVGERATQLVLRTFHLCFHSDTEILDVNNRKYKIKDVYDKIKQGDKFYTFSCSPDGKIYVSRVINAYNDRMMKSYIKITLDNDEKIEATFGHEMMLRNGEYRKIEELKIGDSLMPVDIKEDLGEYQKIDDNVYSYVKSIETVELPEEEAFYDLTVDGPDPNFALGAGVFAHNSGSVQNSSAGGDNDDIISGMSIAKQLFHSPAKMMPDRIINHPGELVDVVYNVFGQYGDLHMVHFEIIVSSMMWVGDKMWRLHPQREGIVPEYISILQVPARSSWLLGVAFSNLKQKLIAGLVGDGRDEESSITSLFRY